MELYRLVLMTLVEVVGELCLRSGHGDLVERCDECKNEIKASDELKKEAG